MRPALAAGFSGGSFCVGPLMVGLLNPSEDQIIDRVVIAPLFAAMYVILALCTGLGLMVVGSIIAKTRMQPPPDAMPRS